MAEDDYMSDTFLQTLGQTSKSKSARSTTSAKRHGTLRSRPAQPKKRHIIEQEQRDKGLSTKLGASNKGFLMLKAMGYKGGALGKTEEGLIDPINVQVKTDKSGLGVATIQRQQQQIDLAQARKARADAELQQEGLVEQFARRQQLLQQVKADERDLFRAQRACHQLDTANGLDEPKHVHFWPTMTQKTEETGESGQGLEPEVVQPDVAQTLAELLDYLRQQHCYCFYCGTSYASEDEIARLCPGLGRLDHDS